MNDSSKAAGMRLLIVGFGAVGRIYARGFADAGARVVAVDPAGDDTARVFAREAGVVLHPALPDSLEGLDLVIILTPASVGGLVARDIAARPGQCPVLDLTSSAPEAMIGAAKLLGERLVDGTVMGAVGLGGLATPMLLAGPRAPVLADLLNAVGCRVTCLDGVAGDASALKLLRSLFMKGLEALVVETRMAAAALGQSGQLPLAFADLAEVDLDAFLTEMLRTHPRHAARRHAEIAAAARLVEGAGLSPVMAGAATAVFARTAGFGSGPDGTPEMALDWLMNSAARQGVSA